MALNFCLFLTHKMDLLWLEIFQNVLIKCGNYVYEAVVEVAASILQLKGFHGGSENCRLRIPS